MKIKKRGMKVGRHERRDPSCLRISINNNKFD